jgi:hypothetical protein
MRKAFFLFLSLFSGFVNSFANQEETDLREYLFEDYNKDVRPVFNHSKAVNCYMGMAIQNLDEFTQMTETAKLNVWIRTQWYDKTLGWNSSISSLEYISVTDELWTPDIEFLNAAGLPEIYVLNGGMYLYPNGLVIYSNPMVLKFSCSMDLHEFPFDIQTCKLKFGSWLYSDTYLHVRPFSDPSKRIDLLDSFSHSEWNVLGVNVTASKESRMCCPGQEFDLLEYEVRLQRYPHYYKLSMGMTIALVIVSFIIMLMNPDNISRTSTAVFIPLTILALQLTIADKIPVVGYYTLMDSFFLCCFITSMIVSIESGIIYSLLTTNSKIVYKIFEPLFDINKLKTDMDERLKKENEYKKQHYREIRDIERNNSSTFDNDNHTEDPVANNEFNSVINNLQELNESSETDGAKLPPILKETNLDEHVDEHNTNNDMVRDEPVEDMGSRRLRNRRVRDNESPETHETQSNHSYNSNYSKIISDKTVRTIDYNDRLLKLTYKEKLIFDRISHWVKIADNVFRVILPIVFFAFVGSLYSYEK